MVHGKMLMLTSNQINANKNRKEERQLNINIGGYLGITCHDGIHFYSHSEVELGKSNIHKLCESHSAPSQDGNQDKASL